MIIEHVIYTLIPAIIIGMFYIHTTHDNPVWLILFATLIPDIDFILQTLHFGIMRNVDGAVTIITHGDFHTIFICYIISVLLGLVISSYTKIRFLDAALCIAIGFMAHLAEDAFVYNPAYAFFAPFSTATWNMAIIPATNDIIIWHVVIGSTSVLLFGLILVVFACAYRWFFQGNDWLDKYNIYPYLLSQIPEIKVINITRISLIVTTFKEYFR